MSANFQFQENLESFVGEKADKEYWLKISSKDANSVSPFDFNVKFNMNILQTNKDSSGNLTKPNYKKEAVIASKYTEVRKIEVTDVIVPRFIPTSTIGLNFDGVNLIQISTGINSTTYICSCYPGTSQKLGTYSSHPYIKLTNPKECIVITDLSGSNLFGDSDSSTFRYKDMKIIDHLTINNMIYPVSIVTGNTVTINNFGTTLPDSTKLIAGNYYTNLILSSTSITCTSTNVIIANTPISLFENLYASNIIRLNDPSSTDNYFLISKYYASGNNIVFEGSYVSFTNSISPGTTVNIYLFGYGTRDLLDDRIFYLELDPFVPVKSSATNDQLDKMFGILFPSTQNKEWLYLSGEPKEVFLPRDVRKLDKISIKLYDSNGVALNDLYINRPGLLNPNYFNNMYTTVVIKVDEIDKVLTVKK
jgi:hypothetical protein